MSFPDYVTLHWSDPDQPPPRAGLLSASRRVRSRPSVPTGLDTGQASRGEDVGFTVLGFVRKPVLARSERLSTIMCTGIHIREAQHLGSASTDGPRMGTDL